MGRLSLTSRPSGTDIARACENCLRRSWLLGRLSARLDYSSRDRERLLELLALGDSDLIAALGGRRREELVEEYTTLDPAVIAPAHGIEAICRHDAGYPASVLREGAPSMLYVAGGLDRLGELTAAPVVAVVGTRRATDYGMETAKSLARGLAASGLTVTSSFTDGIAVAAHAGALEVQGGTIAVMPGDLDVVYAPRLRSLYRRVAATGCAVAELPWGRSARRWGQTASARTVAHLAELTIVVEASDVYPGELTEARLAQSLGRKLAAVPGRVTSPASKGTHRLLMEGAALVRGAQDALELLGLSAEPASGGRPVETARATALTELEPRLRSILEAVGAGRDTAVELTEDNMDGGETLTALSELELMGLLARGDGGRYVPRQNAVPSREREKNR